MNIFLVPYTWLRHLQMAFWCGIFTTTAWWLHLIYFLNVGPFWAPSFDGVMWLLCLVVATSGGSILLEGSLRRAPLRWRIFKVLTATGISFGSFYFISLIYDTTLGPLFFAIFDIIKVDSLKLQIEDDHRIVFQNQLGLFIVAGLCVSMGTLTVRKWKGKFLIGNHILGGIWTGLASGVVWVLFLYFIPSIGNNLYYSGVFSSLTFGFVFGLSAWTIPDELYAGWIRVMSKARFGHRVPIDATEGGTKERFIGSYANGLDIYLPPQEGVMELHVSAYVNSDQEYYLRGLSQQETVLKRMLETVYMNYDPRSPQPAETRLSSEDFIFMGAYGKAEFIMLPREEK